MPSQHKAVELAITGRVKEKFEGLGLMTHSCYIRVIYPLKISLGCIRHIVELITHSCKKYIIPFQGLYATPGCRNDDGGRQVAGITLPFDSCGVSRQRSLNPRGVFVSTTIIVSFHPLFLTKVDRAYRIQCFYMEADKTVRNVNVTK